MRVDLKDGEMNWLIDLVNKAKIEAIQANNDSPHPLYELRRDNMADLEKKLKSVVQKQIQKDRRDSR